jgi:hypothetical protein
MLAVDSRADIHSRHTAGKPTNLSTSMRNDQATELKALAMSTFSSKQDCYLAWSSLVAECMN